MTPLRQKFISALELQNYSQKTISQYTKSIAQFARYFKRCPSELGVEQIREYLQYLRDEKKASSSMHRQVVAALRYLYGQVLGKEQLMPRIPYPRKTQPIRTFLTPEEVTRLLDAVDTPKHRLMLEVLYATGLRVGELVQLRVADIDSENMTMIVRDGKGHKGRFTLLSPELLLKLRAYYREFRPKEWLFEGRTAAGHADECVAQHACTRAAKKAGIKKKVTPQVLRRSFASALHEAGVDVITISRLLGHVHVQTTGVYTNVTLKTLQSTQSPLDLLK